MSVTSKPKLLKKLRSSKEYRDAYVEEHINTGFTFQIKQMREERGWSQAELGKRAGMRQNAISRLEDEDYGSLSLKTALRLAAAFDVGLIFKFVPFSRLLKEYENLAPESLSCKSFTDAEETTAIEVWANDTINISHAEAGKKLLIYILQSMEQSMEHCKLSKSKISSGVVVQNKVPRQTVISRSKPEYEIDVIGACRVDDLNDSDEWPDFIDMKDSIDYAYDINSAVQV